MKLNPSKCSFGMEEGRFLGFTITPRGIKANPKKIQAIENMQSPRSKKHVQSLNGKLAALTRFLSRAADRALPFFQTLKGCLSKKDFISMDEAEKAFQDVKAFLKEIPTLTAPIPGETLTIYLVASSEAISSVLIADRGKTQMQVFTGQLIKHVLTRPEISGRMAKRNNVTRRETDELWELYTDGASSEEGAGIGLLLVSPNGEEITYAIRLKFAASNNEAKYEALIARLRLAKSIDVRQLTAYVDSQLVASQLNGSFEARDTSMQKYLKLTKALTKTFAAFEIKQIPRNRNKKVDALSKLASLLYDQFTKKVMVEVLERKSTEEDTFMATITTEEECWMTPFIKYLADGTVPEDKLQARRIRMRAVISPRHNMIPIHAAWLFCKWGIDIVGPFPRGVGNVKFLVIAIDYFTKWVEAKPLSTITGRKILTFVWEDIVCCFGLPREIVSDNGT
ncbi:uncharacterized protein [Rutidosis leptorrhynchoides]|uniref:uncharacterized protein n=1 Tax=Rutidosis leptorrhynchoides TaxID=125765 RepID=UPI003A9A1884